MEEKQWKAWLKANKPKVKCVLYKGWTKTSTHKCVCGYKWKAQPLSIYTRRGNKGCPLCSKLEGKEKQRLVKAKEYKLHISKLDLKLIDPYKTALSKSKHQCLRCNHKFMVKPNDVKNLGLTSKSNRCPNCKKRKLVDLYTKPDSFYIKAIQRHKKVQVLEVLKVQVKCKCVKCNLIFNANKSDLLKGSGCPDCGFRLQQINTYKHKQYKLGKRLIRVQGYESFALDYLLNLGIKPSQIVTDMDIKCPIIKMQDNSKYYPDIYIKSLNKIVEVKSEYTLGVNKPILFYRVQFKGNQTKRAGFKFELLVFDYKGNKMKMPKNWLNLNFREFKKQFRELN